MICMRLNGGLSFLSPEAPPAEKTVLLHIENILGSICRSTDATRQNHNAPIIINEAARSRYPEFADYNGRVWFSRVAWWVSLVGLLSISVIRCDLAPVCECYPREPVAHVCCGAICFCAVRLCAQLHDNDHVLRLCALMMMKRTLFG